MTMFKGAIFGLFLWLGLSCSVDASGSSCKLPTMARFRRTIYRPYLGPRTNNYTAGSVLNNGAIVVAICKSDVIGDLITKRLVSKCRNGKWRPKLPKCIVNTRCDAPPVIENATPSENVSPYQTFPHKTSITYTCDTDKMATRNNIMVCINGRWTNRNLKCIDRQDMPSDQQISEHSKHCLNLNVINGRVVPISITYGIYRVMCNKEYRLVPRRRYRCKKGVWRGIKPKCVRVKPTVQLVSQQKDNPTVQLVSEQKDKLTDHLVSLQKDKPTDQVVSQQKDKPTDQVVPEQKDKPAVQLVPEQKDKPTVQLVPEQNDKPAVQLVPEQKDKPTVQAVSVQKVKCENLSVLNGVISTNNVTNGFYNVTCYNGYQLVPRQRYKCQAGKWIGTVPKCVRATPNCRMHTSAMRISYFKSATTGRMVSPMSVDHMAEVIQICKRQPSRRRQVKCINGRWRPTLMTCRSPRLYRQSGRLRHKRSTNKDSTRQKRSENSCKIPKVRGGPSRFTASRETRTLTINKSVPDGQKVIRKCLNGGFMLLPGVQMSENITSKCDHGKWTPGFPRCLRDIKDTVFFDHLQIETTTQSTLKSTTTKQVTSGKKSSTHTTVKTTKTEKTTSGSKSSTHTTVKTTKTEQTTSGPKSSAYTTMKTTSTEQTTSGLISSAHTTVKTTSTEQTTSVTTPVITTTQEPSINYRINVSVISKHSNIYLFINDREKGFVIKLNGSKVSVHARAVRKISKIHFGITADWEKSSKHPPENVNFVSIYMKNNGIDQFFIERFDGKSNNPACARSFNVYTKKSPAWDKETFTDIEIKDCKDLITCKIKCIEYSGYDCRAAYYSQKLELCTLFDIDIDPNNGTTKSDLVMVKRNDDCTTQK